MACRMIGTNPLFQTMLDIVNWTIRNKFQQHFKRNAYIFILENAFENVSKMTAIFSRTVLESHFLFVSADVQLNNAY